MANDPIISTSGIYGSDHNTPIYDPDGRFQIWKKSEVFMGAAPASNDPGSGKYVPKIGDYVVDDPPLIFYKVTNIDIATLAPTLQELTMIKSDANDETLDILLAGGPESFRVYIDSSVNPHAVSVDRRCYVRGSNTAYARIYRGTNIDDPSKIISLQYDSAGNVIGDKIPLEPAEIDNSTNITTKIMPTCYTMQEVLDGEVCTFVAYSLDNIVISKHELLADNTSFISSPNITTKYINGISLECPFLSQTDPRRIDLPQNVLLPGVNMVGVVHYSDGTSVKMPVDGTKFTMLGLNAYIATVVGHQANLVLRYNLSPGEVCYGSTVGAQPVITEAFTIVTAQEDNAYSVKLYGYPEWQNSIQGFRLRWFLYTAARDVMYDVTNIVNYSAQNPFNPTLYGVTQNVVVSVNLQDVNGSYRNYRHTQTETLVLLGAGTIRTTNWTIYFDQNQQPPYGVDNHADLTFVNYNYWKLKVDLGAATQADWLDRLYYKAKPLMDTSKELVPPAPTHFRITVGGQTYEQSIANWNQEIIVENGLTDNSTVYLEFISKNPNTNLQLAVAGVQCWQTNPGQGI